MYPHPSVRLCGILASAFMLIVTEAGAESATAPDPSYQATEDLFFQDLPVVLTASRLAQPVSEIPNAITIIDHDMIHASGSRTIPELFRLVPGMYVGYENSNLPVVSYHGATDGYARRMQVLVDGRSIYLPPFSTVSWADLPIQIDDIDHIEVIRGPAAASHGANSFYGVINIITRNPTSKTGQELNARRGSHQANDAHVSQSSIGEMLNYRLSASYRSDAGYHASLNDHNLTRLANIQASYRASDHDTLELRLGTSSGTYGYGIGGRLQDAFRDTTKSSNFQHVNWLHTWDSGDESKLSYYHLDQRYTDPHICINTALCQSATPAAGFTQFDIHSQRHELEFQNTNQTSENNRVVWGASYRQDWAESPLVLAHPYTLDYARAFIHDEWRFAPSALLNVGTMLESDGMGNRSNSPRVSLNYHVTPNDTLRLGISTATRSPAMAEVFVDANSTLFGGAYFSSTTPVTPERIRSHEIAYLGKSDNDKLSFDARAYYDQVKNLIWWDNWAQLAPVPADTMRNMMDAEYRGIETTAKYRWNEGKSFAVASYSRQFAKLSQFSTPTSISSPIPFSSNRLCPGATTVGECIAIYYQREYVGLYPETVPKHNVSFLLSQRLSDNVQLSANFNFRTQVRVINVATDVQPESVMRRLDLRVARTFGQPDRRINGEISFIVQNVLQDGYNKFGTINEVAAPLYGRRAYLMLSLNH